MDRMKRLTLVLVAFVVIFNVVFVALYSPKPISMLETTDNNVASLYSIYGNGSKPEAPCPFKPIDLRAHGSTRQQYVPVCTDKAHLKLVEVNTTWLPSLNRSDPCLPRLIARHCMDGMRIPNVIHHVWLGKRNFTLIHLMSFLSVKFQNPCLVLIHSDVLPWGPLWEYYLHQQPRVLHVFTTPPDSILGNEITLVEQKSDIVRIKALRDFGGIYLDTDAVLLRSVTELRSHPMVNSYEDPGNVASSTLMAAPNATFLTKWLDHYDDFRANEWGYHAILVPGDLVKQYPHLVHNVGHRFVGPGYFNRNLYYYDNYDWTRDYAIHFYSRDDTHVYTVQNVLWMENTVASVARHVLYGRKQACPSFRTE